MPARVHIVIGGHLCMSPRGQREASVLQDAGYDVTVSGIAFDREMSSLDEEIMRRQKLRFAPAWDMSGRGQLSKFNRFTSRINGRLARERFRLWGMFSPALLGYGTRALLETCLRQEPDLTIVHSEAGLWIAGELLHHSWRVGVDFEDWFSRDLPPESRRDRPVAELARLECELLQGASYRVASSRAMAAALAAAYRVREPTVVSNAISLGQRAPLEHLGKDRVRKSPLSLHWFSQTIGPGRGLEPLFEALPGVRHPVRVSLRGACGPECRRWLGRVLPTEHQSMVAVLPPVPPWELPSHVAEHDIGLALETDTIPSRDVCLSNKFFHYLNAGLAIIATNTQGQREGMAACPDAGIILRGTCPMALAEAIDTYAENPERLRAARNCALGAAATIWNGNQESVTILAEAQRAISPVLLVPADQFPQPNFGPAD